MPHVDPTCTTHHNACACRESRYKRMEEALRRVEEGEMDIAPPGSPNHLVTKVLHGEMMTQIREVLREGI